MKTRHPGFSPCLSTNHFFVISYSQDWLLDRINESFVYRYTTFCNSQAECVQLRHEFSIEASNALRHGATALTVRGPDVDGLLASMTAALSVRGCSLVELHAKRSHTNLQEEDADLDPDDRSIEDTFYVIKRETGLPFDDDELEELARGLLDATRTPMNVNSVKAAMHELENTNSFLRKRIAKLEEVVYRQQITIQRKDGKESTSTVNQ